MPAVLTIDQRRSREARDQAGDWVSDLNGRFGQSLLLPFTSTAGDEIQGLTEDPKVVIDIVLEGVRHESWWLGLGLGAVEKPLAATANRSRGPAFYNARDAVEAAKKSHYGFAVRAADPGVAADVQATLELLAFLIRRRGQDPKRWQAVELAHLGESSASIGAQLGISQQAAWKRLRNAGVDEEIEGRRLASRLIGTAMETA
jgi:hypothetical protein